MSPGAIVTAGPPPPDHVTDERPSSAPEAVRDAGTGRRMIHSLKARADAHRSGPQRLADWMTDAFGSNAFLLINAIWFAVWCVWNAHVIPGLEPFDPFPFGLLTMIVSLEAILLSIFVLIAQNRSERIDELRQEIDLQVNLIAEDELTKLLCLVAKIAEKQGIDVASDQELQQMLAPTNVEKIERVLEHQLAHLKTKDAV
jgi:uncharacterized membrane protein